MWHGVGGAIGWRAVQQVGVQLIYFARLLLLARLLAPEAFGLLAVAMLALTVLLSLTDLGTVSALVQRPGIDRDEHDAAWTVRLIRAAGIALTLAVAAPAIAIAFDAPGATPIIQALALRPLIEAAGSIGVVRLTREFRFRALALIHVPAALVDAAVAVILAGAVGVWALVAGALAGAAAATVLSHVLAPHRPRLVFRLSAAAPLIRFGRWVLGTSIVGLIATSGAQLVISRQLGLADLGIYFLATKIAFLPADAASTVVGSVAFPLYASLQRNTGATIATFRSLLSGQAAILFPVYVLLIVLAPSLSEVLGANWVGTAPLIQIISVAALGGLYADSALPLLMGRGRPDRVMLVVSAQTAILLALLVPCIVTFGIMGAAIAWLPAYAAALVTSVGCVRRAVGSPLADSGSRLLVLLSVALAAGSAAAFVQAWFNGLAALVPGAALGALTAALLLRVVTRRMDLGVHELLSVRPAHLASQLLQP